MANVFHLPDLGEGIPEAEIHQWHVKVGDVVEMDAVLASMETAKAVVDVPAPFSGTITALHGKPGDIIHTGEPLVSYDGTDETRHTTSASATTTPPSTTPSTPTIQQRDSDLIKTLPAVRVLATHLGVDLAEVQGTGTEGMITPEDVKHAAAIAQPHPNNDAIPDGFTALTSVRRQMAQAMTRSHTHVVPVTLVDDANISAWVQSGDITARVVRAIVSACQQEPALNAWLTDNAAARQCHSQVDLGIAMDTADGLFVPVLRNANTLTATAIRDGIQQLKQTVANRSIAPDLLRDPTITLSNFGMFAGRYATPIVVPPTVAIIATGRLYTTLQQTQNGKIEQQHLLPLSITVDHRACTGGEAARFLKAMLADLSRRSAAKPDT